MKHLYVCIMAGGSGERFWPLSRKAVPKHLLKLFSEKTLLEETVERIKKVVPENQIAILTNQEQREAICRLFPSFSQGQIIGEPAKRDTAPACALGTAWARQKDPQAVVALIASDHLIQDHSSFARNLTEAAQVALKTDAFITFSIKPTWPSPDLGYLELGEQLKQPDEKTSFFKVKRFVEKPNSATATEYIESGRFGWNSGMFVWRADFFISEAKHLQPELADFIEKFPSQNSNNYIKEHFPKLPRISVDYAIMEKAERVTVAEARFDWDDMGSWTALPAHLETDEHKNSTRGTVAVHDSHGNIAISSKRMIALCGVKDLIVIETDDAILVCHRDAAEQIKHLQPKLPDEVK